MGWREYFLSKKEAHPDICGSIDPAADDNYAIRQACENGHLDVVQLLLEKKETIPALYGSINPAADDNYGIRNARKNGHKDVVQLLLEKKKDFTGVIFKNFQVIY